MTHLDNRLQRQRQLFKRLAERDRKHHAPCWATENERTAPMPVTYEAPDNGPGGDFLYGKKYLLTVTEIPDKDGAP